MSRPIKFRAWTHQNPPMQWFSKNVAITGNGEQMTPIGGTFTGIWHTLGDRDEGLIIEQYTGLTDKNGKEIYEGDIVRYHSDILLGYAICVVTFYNCRWTLFQHDAPVWAISEGDSENIEVIGNIHENPELLGGEE